MAGRVDRSIQTLRTAGRVAARQRARETAAAVADARVRALEAEVTELKGRVNGLVFVLIGAVATQVIVRLFG